MTADKHNEDGLDRDLHDPAFAELFFALRAEASRPAPPVGLQLGLLLSTGAAPRPRRRGVRGATVGLVVVGVVAGGVGAAAAAGAPSVPSAFGLRRGERRRPTPGRGRRRRDLADRHPVVPHGERRARPGGAHLPQARRGGHRRREQLRRRGQPVRARRTDRRHRGPPAPRTATRATRARAPSPTPRTTTPTATTTAVRRPTTTRTTTPRATVTATRPGAPGSDDADSDDDGSSRDGADLDD